MKKWLVAAYLVLSISVMLTAIAWLTWSNTCHDVLDLTSTDEAFAGVCSGDKGQFIRVAVGCMIIALTYVIITATVFMRILGVRLTRSKTKDTPS